MIPKLHGWTDAQKELLLKRERSGHIAASNKNLPAVEPWSGAPRSRVRKDQEATTTAAWELPGTSKGCSNPWLLTPTQPAEDHRSCKSKVSPSCLPSSSHIMLVIYGIQIICKTLSAREPGKCLGFSPLLSGRHPERGKKHMPVSHM